MSTWAKRIAFGLAVGMLAAGPGRAAEEITLLSTVSRAVNVPMLVGLKLLEEKDGIKVTVRDLRSPEAVLLAVIDGQGQFATGFAPFYPAIEKGADVKGLMELSRPEFVIMAAKEIGSVRDLNGKRLASHSPKSTVQSLTQYFLNSQPGVKPEFVFIPEGSPARAEALLRGAVPAAAFDLSAAAVVNQRAPGKFHTVIDFTGQAVSSSVLVVNGDFAKKRPDVVRKLLHRVLESYRAGLKDPGYWLRERGDALKGLDDEKLDRQLRPLVKIFDPNGGIERLRGKGAMGNIEFQVASGNLSAPASKWAPEKFYDVAPLEAVLKELGK